MIGRGHKIEHEHGRKNINQTVLCLTGSVEYMARDST
jgi:hypothetical protein